MVNLSTKITIIDAVIDCPNITQIRDVCTWLERGMIEGHRILHVDYTGPMPKDIVKIPHRGHGYTCHGTEFLEASECLERATLEDYKYTRYFNIDLIVEGSVYLTDLETCDFKVLDAFVMLVFSRSAPLAAESDRFELEAWTD